jgi:hypothetical protein
MPGGDSVHIKTVTAFFCITGGHATVRISTPAAPAGPAGSAASSEFPAWDGPAQIDVEVDATGGRVDGAAARREEARR